jgi:hypothetical protein
MKSFYFLIVILFFGCDGGDTPPSQRTQQTNGEPYVVHCSEPLPVFTLGRNSNLTKEQEKALCECIWNNLGSWEREVSKKIAQGRESEISQLHIRAFPSRFGSAIEKCGGMKL